MSSNDTTDDTDAVLAVVAHGLLNTLASLTGALRTLDHHWDVLAPEKQRELLELAEARCDVMEGILRDLIRATPPETVHALDELADR
ncbi:MAG: hypothetical protein JWN67_3303 [Actinomycetia bacterium]|nr:hypothetical protein [Actinomycetes bacterium]